MRPIRALIVEDNAMVARVNQEYVNQVAGFEVVGIAETGAEAIRLVQGLRPDLVVLDIYLPDMNGIDALQEIRRLEIPTDVLLVTAARDVETIQHALRHGAVDYIIKPFKFERLKASLESYQELFRKFHLEEALEQADIDRLRRNGSTVNGGAPPGPGAPAPEELPKGLNGVTLRQILLYLIKAGECLSAEAVAEGVGVARVTARRYLDYLVKTGRARLTVQYGSVGRPVNLYCSDGEES